MTRESVLLKVKQLLALAEGNDNVHEAAAAMGRAQRYLQDHNLSMAEVDNIDDGEAEEPIDHGGELFGGDTQALATWKKQLAMCVSRANSCYFYTATICKMQPNGRRKRVRVGKLIGRASDVQITHYMFAAMTREIDRLCSKVCTGRGRTWANSFRMGAMSAIRDRIAAEQREANANASHTAIVRVEARYDSVVAWTESAASGLKLRSVSASPARRDNGAFSSGYRAGQNVHARSGLRAAGGAKLLK